MKRLYRSEHDRKLCGVCGGLGDYFNLDPTILRCVAVFLVLWVGTGLVAYIIASIIIPSESDV